MAVGAMQKKIISFVEVTDCILGENQRKKAKEGRSYPRKEFVDRPRPICRPRLSGVINFIHDGEVLPTGEQLETAGFLPIHQGQ